MFIRIGKAVFNTRYLRGTGKRGCRRIVLTGAGAEALLAAVRAVAPVQLEGPTPPLAPHAPADPAPRIDGSPEGSPGSL